MGAGMNLEKANEYAKTMSYRKAVNNIRYAKGIAYKKATRIKLRELAEIADRLVTCGECKHRETCCRPCYKSADGYCSDGEREDKPQTCEECEHWNDPEDGCADRHGCKTKPQTEIVNDCTGCRFVGSYNTEFPCANCVRKNKDYYDSE